MEIYALPSINLVGRGSVGELGREALRFSAKRALVVASAGDVGGAQAEQIASILKGSGIDSLSFCEVTPNPTEETVVRGAELYRNEGCDMLAAVGGGSAIDAAKGIGLLASNGGSVADYEGGAQGQVSPPPLRRRRHDGRDGQQGDAVRCHLRRRTQQAHAGGPPPGP